MRNNISEKVPDLLSQAALAKTGADSYGAGIPLVQNTAGNIGNDRDGLVNANTAAEQAKVTLAQRRTALVAAALAARAFVLLGRDILKPFHGNEYSTAWNEAGFTNGLQVSRAPGDLYVHLESLQAYFIAHNDREAAALNITAARAGVLLGELGTARANVAAQETEVQTARRSRNTAVTVLRKRIRGVFNEMKQFIDPLDPRWTAFGFNKPGAQSIPDVPENVTVTLVGSNGVAVQWSAAARAERYRVWKKVAGVDAEFVAVESVADVDFVIEGLPGNATIEIAVSAVNNGGESQRSAVVTIVTP